jgi:hypothetical protein
MESALTDRLTKLRDQKAYSCVDPVTSFLWKTGVQFRDLILNFLIHYLIDIQGVNSC